VKTIELRPEAARIYRPQTAVDAPGPRGLKLAATQPYRVPPTYRRLWRRSFLSVSRLRLTAKDNKAPEGKVSLIVWRSLPAFAEAPGCNDG